MENDGLLLNIVSEPAPRKRKRPSGHNGYARSLTNTTKILPRPRTIDGGNDTVRQANIGAADVTLISSSKADHTKKRRQDEIVVKHRIKKLDGTTGTTSDQITKEGRVAGHVVSSLFDYHDPLPAMKPALKPVTAASPTTKSNAPNPSSTEFVETSFLEMSVVPELVSTMKEKLEVTIPTSIQREVLPVLLNSSKDVFIRAETGSGKTLAYLLPILNRLCLLPQDFQSRQKGSYALIIAPTRELAQQIYHVLDTLLNSRRARWMVGVLLIGGEKKKSEKARLRKGATIVIATPGRLKDHLDSTQCLDVSGIQWIVLDEGDRLMDLGFETSIIDILRIVKDRQGRRIVAESMPDRRVTIICSATAKDNVNSLGEQSLEDAVFIDAGKLGPTPGLAQGTVAPSQLKQQFIVVPTKLRLVTLIAAVQKAFSSTKPCRKVIVFLSCGSSVDYHFSLFSRPIEGEEQEFDPEISMSLAPRIYKDLRAFKLHGSLPQQVRTQTLQTFAKCKEPAILLCTDVASRGLDLQVDFVIQYDPPFGVDDYTHRIGRTARAGRAGSAMIFTLKSEAAYLELIKTTLECELEEVNVKFLLKNSFGQDFEDRATKWQMDFEKWANQASRIDNAKAAFASHIRAYATHAGSERQCFPIHQLQLGHVAKSFGLRDAPSNIANSLPKSAKVKASERKGVAASEEKEKFGPTDIQMRMRQSIAAQSKALEFNVI